MQYYNSSTNIGIFVLQYRYCMFTELKLYQLIYHKNFFNKNWIKFEDCPPQHWFLSLHWMQSAFWNINWIRSTLKQWESNDYKQYQDEIYGLLYIISSYCFPWDACSTTVHWTEFNMVIGWKTYQKHIIKRPFCIIFMLKNTENQYTIDALA